MPNITSVFEKALLSYIQQHVDQLAEGILEWGQPRPFNCGCSDDDTCMCYDNVSVEVSYRVPREVSRMGYYNWTYYGDLPQLMRMLDREDLVTSGHLHEPEWQRPSQKPATGRWARASVRVTACGRRPRHRCG